MGTGCVLELRWTTLLENQLEGRVRVISEGLNGRTTALSSTIGGEGEYDVNGR